jgi:hypothetical protein
MKLIFAGVLLNLILIILFGLIYWNFSNQFNNDSTNNRIRKQGNVIDCFYMSITIQAGVGYQGLTPISDLGKFLLMAQQLCMISSNIIVIYLIHLHFFKL